MALPNNPAAEKIAVEFFLKSIKPIWPNLTKKQTEGEFWARRQTIRQQKFYSQAIDGIASDWSVPRNILTGSSVDDKTAQEYFAVIGARP